MREIEFRGKRENDKKWLYGDLSYGGPKNNHKKFANINIWEDGLKIGYVVKQETIGQYTGLKDKNGKKIFEGDIVKFRFKKDRVECSDLIGYIEYQSTFTGFRIMSYKGSFKIDALETIIEVIGNIYDNPELLKETMNDKIQVGEYVRTKKGDIDKIDRYIFESNIYCCKNGMCIDKENEIGLHLEDIIKHSKTIIDLIEVGDYVNGMKVLDKVTNTYLLVSSSDYNNNKVFDYMIKSIVTKEQFSSVAFNI